MAPRLFIKFLSKAVYLKTFYICNLLSLWALSNCCDPFDRCISYFHDQDHVHSTYFTNFYTRSWASIPQNKNSIYSWLFSPRLKGHELLKKERKNGHMKVQSIKKKVDTWRSNVFQKKVSPCPKESKREIAHERSSYFIHKFHTLAHLDQGLWLVSPKGFGLWLSNTKGAGILSTFPYPVRKVSMVDT